MVDLKKIANIRIGGPKYPYKKRINLYQREFRKSMIAAQIGVFILFMALLHVFVQFGVIMPMQEADRAEMAYERMVKQLDAAKRANSIMPEVTERYAHYGSSWQTDRERLLPDRLMMLEVMKNKIFPVCENIESFTLMDDQIAFSCRLDHGALLSDMVRQIEEDENVRYVTASVESTLENIGNVKKNMPASEKKVTVNMVIYFKQAGESEEEQQ